MTNKSVDTLKREGSATVRPVLTTTELLELAARAFDKRKMSNFSLINETEHKSLAELRAVRVGGTVLGPVEVVLQANGIQTDGTLGSLMDNLGLNEQDVHDFACNCHTHSMPIDGAVAAHRLRTIAGKK